MPNSKAETFAQLLGLSEGIDAGPAEMSPYSDVEEASLITVQTRNVGDSALVALTYEVAASYLPSFLRIYFGNPMVLSINDEETSAIWCYQNVWLLDLIKVPAFPRFIRTYPDEARSMYLNLMKRVANLEAWTYEEASYEFQTVFFPRFLFLVQIFAQIVACHLPEGVPSLDPVTSAGLLVRMKRLVKVTDRMPAEIGPGHLASSVGTCFVLAGPTAIKEMADFKQTVLRNPNGTVWSSCQFSVNKNGALQATCEELAGGQTEMRACGRCLAVRYCSQEHQKADWKAHKLLCFAQSW